eukprot:216298-Rhodomonas_salina.1
MSATGMGRLSGALWAAASVGVRDASRAHVMRRMMWVRQAEGSLAARTCCFAFGIDHPRIASLALTASSLLDRSARGPGGDRGLRFPPRLEGSGVVRRKRRSGHGRMHRRRRRER